MVRNAREDESFGEGAVVYDDLDRTLSLLREHEMAHGPFDGVLGFSQGGCVAHLVCMLQQQEEGAWNTESVVPQQPESSNGGCSEGDSDEPHQRVGVEMRGVSSCGPMPPSPKVDGRPSAESYPL